MSLLAETLWLWRRKQSCCECQAAASGQGPQFYNLQEVDFAINLDEDGGGLGAPDKNPAGS